MRITGGKYCRQGIKAPGGLCRPTQDMVREALFSIIGPRVCGSRFLDMFAGSGAVGLEALSRGARSVCWVECNRRTFATLKENAEHVCGKEKDCDSCPEMRFFLGDAITFLQKGLESRQFDLIFADPPYDREGRKGWLSRLLRALGEGKAMSPGGIFIMEQSSDEEMKEDGGWDLIKDRFYGNTRLGFYVRKGVQ